MQQQRTKLTVALAVIAPMAVLLMAVELVKMRRELDVLRSKHINLRRSLSSKTTKDDDSSVTDAQEQLTLKASSYEEMAKKFQTDDYIVKPEFYKPMESIHRKYHNSERFTIVEFGRGKGGSTWFWPSWLPQSLLVSVDITPWEGTYKWKGRGKTQKKPNDTDRIEIIEGSQTDNKTLANICAKHQDIKLIIDDASHYNKASLRTFEAMFPCLLSDGTYVVEDIQTSYSKQYGGSCDPTDPNTLINYFKSMVDQMQLVDVDTKTAVKHPFAESITGLHFYHDLLIIDKGPNKRGQSGLRAGKLC